MAEDREDREQLAEEALHARILRVLDGVALARALPEAWTPPPDAVPGGSQGMLRMLLERAAMNQTDAGPATLGRYGNWAHGACHALVRAVGYLDHGQPDAARAEMIAVANALRAFAVIQKLIDEHEDRPR